MNKPTGLNDLPATEDYATPVQLELPLGDDFTQVQARANVLRTAEAYITKDRANEHGNMEDNFKTIATYWSEHLGTKVTAIDVAIMMTLLKIARMRGTTPNMDNYVDGCGYLACGGELIENELKIKSEAMSQGT